MTCQFNYIVVEAFWWLFNGKQWYFKGPTLMTSQECFYTLLKVIFHHLNASTNARTKNVTLDLRPLLNL